MHNPVRTRGMMGGAMECNTCTITDASRRLGVSRSAAYRAAQSGYLAEGVRVLRVGRRLVVPIADLDRALGWPPPDPMARVA